MNVSMSDRIKITLHKVVNFSQNDKYSTIQTLSKGMVFRAVLLFIAAMMFSIEGYSQKKPTPKPGTQPTNSDSFSSKSALRDTAKVKKDTTKTTQKGDIENTIVYSAEDSIISEMGKKIIHLYGNAKVTYGQMNMDAELITIDYDKSIITANGVPDSTGRMIGFPIFKDGQETYETRGMIYNFKTKKAKITEVVTKQGEGFMHGESVYKNSKNDLLTRGNAYTTCDLADPHFRIISTKAKAIPGDKIVSGPFYMEFNHVPTPLGFAFGIFPSQRKSASGIIVPVYGEEQIRGFFLKRGGYYFDINDYIKLSLTADLYSKGSTGLYINTNYISRYRYSGTLNFSYNNNVYTQQIESPNVQKDFSLQWSHAPKTKGSFRFTSSVNLATNSNNANNYYGIGPTNTTAMMNSNSQQKASSNVSISKSFPGTPFALGFNLRHNQDFKSRRLDLSLPDVSFNVNNIYPFKKSQSRILQNFQFKYTMNGVNQINNDLGLIKKTNGTTTDSIGVFNLQTLNTYIKNGNQGIKHVLPLQTSFKVLKFLTGTAQLNYNELWYFSRLVWGTAPTAPLSLGSQAVKIDTIHQFSRESFYNLSFSVNTRIYGMYLAKNKNARIRAIRHVMNPSIGFSYAPDFSDPKYGYYQRLGLTDANGRPYIALHSIHEGYTYGTAPTGKNESMTFGIGNAVEMKVRNEKDTVDRKVSLLNNLSISSSYNFLADSMKLSPFGISANTNVMNNKININLSGSLDPYQYKKFRNGVNALDQPTYTIIRVNQYAWQAGGLGRITTATLAFSTNLNSKGQKKDNETRDKISKSNASQADKDYLLQHPDTYVDFTIPWNVRLSYNLGYSNSNPNSSPTITQALRFSGDFSLSTKWKITYNSGYDFVGNQFTQTNISLNRDLHCWQMSVNWTPFGKFQSYTFNIGIKSSLLKDLKLNRTRSFSDSWLGY
ncbi:MAG: LPS-assembly protein LptD [Cytophagales bacterium]|nr:MAG: LPS-assembly protein LptD [Cytophagales bacterium]